MLAVGDPQVKNNEQVGYFREEGIADMRKLMAADASKRYFALILGDLVYDQIVIIDPATGVVEGVVDLTGLLPDEEVTPTTDVLNGIAYDAAGKRIFVTGKNWSKLFEIEIIGK